MASTALDDDVLPFQRLASPGPLQVASPPIETQAEHHGGDGEYREKDGEEEAGECDPEDGRGQEPERIRHDALYDARPDGVRHMVSGPYIHCDGRSRCPYRALRLFRPARTLRSPTPIGGRP
jgi:hypothetical protein